MEESPEYFAWVNIPGERGTVRFANNSTQRIERDVLLKSKLLHQFVCDSEDGDPILVPLPARALRRWLYWRATDHNTFTPSEQLSKQLNTSCADRMTSELLVECLQAADYLGDDEAVKQLCKLSARHLVPKDCLEDEVAPSLASEGVQILQMLPETLQISVLAFAVASCIQLLKILPEDLHLAALHSKYPSIERDGTVRISTRDVLLKGPWTRFWNLLAMMHGLKRLELKFFKTSRPICAPLAAFTSLTHLKVNGMNGQFLTDELGGNWPLGSLISLRHLDLVDNCLEDSDLEALAPEIRQLETLQHLDLKNNAIECNGAELLAQCIHDLTHLQYLDLGLNDIEHTGVSALIPALVRLTNLTFLDLGHSFADEMGARSLGQLLLSLPNLQHLAVEGDAYASNSLLLRLPNLLFLQHLDFKLVGRDTRFWQSRNETQDGEERPICIAAQLTELCQVKHLGLNIHIEATTEDFERIGPALGHLLNLSSVRISVMNIGDEGVKRLLANISRLPDLQRLVLEDVPDGDDGAAAVGHYFKAVSPPLQLFKFCPEDEISSDAARAMFSGLKSVTTLEHLSLSNLTWDKGATRAFAESLVCLTRLTVLNLEESYLKDAEMLVLGPSIPKLTALQELTIAAGEYDQEGGILALAPQLAQLVNLRILTLQGSPGTMDELDAEALEIHLGDLPVLKKVTFDYRNIVENGVYNLLRLLSRNTSIESLVMPSITRVQHVTREDGLRLVEQVWDDDHQLMRQWNKKDVGRLITWEQSESLSDTGSIDLLQSQRDNRSHHGSITESGDESEDPSAHADDTDDESDAIHYDNDNEYHQARLDLAHYFEISLVPGASFDSEDELDF